MAAQTTLFVTSFILLVMNVDTQFSDNPILPPYGCANFGVCHPTFRRSDPDFSPPRRYCLEPGCMCNAGTLPHMCHVDPTVNLCLSNPCSLNGGEWNCTTMINNYNCTCKAGYTGSDCKIPLSDPCSSSPCENDGVCTVQSGSYSCDCPDDKSGDRCQYDNTCVTQSDKCKNGGTCKMVFHGEDYICRCKAEWQGRHCDQNVTIVTEKPLGCWNRTDLQVNKRERLDLSNEPSATKCRNKLFEAVRNGKQYDTYAISGELCFLTLGNLFVDKLESVAACDHKCTMSSTPANKNYTGSNEICGSGSLRAAIVTQYVSSNELKQCDNKNCHSGLCVEGYNTAECICPRERKLQDCEFSSPDPCVNNTCASGSTCKYNFTDYSYTCKCAAGFTGKYCKERLHCTPNPCKYGSKCVEKQNDYECECLQYWTGKDCDVPNFCGSNPCNNGDCATIKNGLESSFNCTCFPGWSGTYCTIDINECAYGANPCQHGGICAEVTPPADPFYECTCVAGTTGKDCEINPDDCINATLSSGKVVNSCAKYDPSASCVDGFNMYKCNCSEEYTGEHCDIEVIIYDILMKIYGQVNDEMLEMLKALLANPSMIKDMVPFILGMEPEDMRSGRSWDHEDLFDWASYEEQKLNLKNDLVKWNDVTLGNCFTFNHRNNTDNNYLKRMIGQEGGFHALMKINGEEYFPWVDTEAIQVFVHPSEDDIFSESVRYNAQPNGETEIYPYLTEYGRLGGRYGVCVEDPKEVKAYYYTGAYTTDGCLRSCYQNAVLEDCNCMDPRYPMPTGVNPCNLEKRKCVEEISTNRGDPSKWKDCVCPLPCKNRQYTVRWSKSVYVGGLPQCNISIAAETSEKNRQNCTKAVRDTVLVRVTMPGLGFSLFKEEPAMDLQRFIGNLGGLLGVLCGISIITFIEFGFLIIRIWIIIMSNK